MTKPRRLAPFPVDPRYAGIYAHGVEVREPTKAVFVSGQIGIAPTGELAGGFRDQCRQAIRNVEAVLKESDLTLQDIVKMTFFLTNRGDIAELVEVRKALLADVAPAITTVIVAGLVSPDWCVEVEAYATSTNSAACSSAEGSS